LEQRLGKGIWQNLYQFPLLETNKEIALDIIRKEALTLLKLNRIADVYLFNDKPIIHKLSHQHLHTKFWILQLDTEIRKGIPWEEITNFPVPVLIADFIKTFKI
jgi:A/G-specific adenine glycosylase